MKKVYKTITALLLVCIMVIPGSLSVNAATVAFATNYTTLKTAIDNKADTIIIINNITLEDVIGITYDVTIASNGATIYPASGKRHFNVMNNSQTTVTFQDVVLDGANIGGGIFAYGDITIKDAVIQNCITSAVYNRGYINLTGCNINNNKATEGGGVFNSATMDMSNCTFTNNKAYQDGGGVYCYAASSVNMYNCKFTNNNADAGAGGAIYATGSTTVNTCTLTGNVAYKGGAIYFTSATTSANHLSVFGSTISNNAAGRGAGIYTTGNIFIFGNYFTNNSAGYDGGAIYININASTGGGYNDFNNNTPNDIAVFN